MTGVIILITHEGQVGRSTLIVSDTAATADRAILQRAPNTGMKLVDAAEKLFKIECKRKQPDLTDEQLETLTDEGYFEHGDWTVQLHWPQEIHW